MSDVSEFHNRMYKSGYNSGLSRPIQFLIKNYSLPREKVINEYVTEGDTLVDLGCGTGNFCKLAALKFKKVYGLDFATECVEIARKREIPNAEFRVFDLNQASLPFPDQSVDTIVAIVTLDYVCNLNSLITDISRILKNDGNFIFQVNNLGFLPRRLRLLIGKYPKVSSVSNDEWPRIGWDGSVCHLFTRQELLNFLKQFGFSAETITGSGIFRQFRRWWPSLLCGDLIFICKNATLPTVSDSVTR